MMGNLAWIADILGLWVAAILTLVVFSYLLADNPLYRLAEHLFVGIALGYATLIAYHQVLKPKLFAPLLADPMNNLWLLPPLLLGLLLLFKLSPSFSWVGNSTIGYLLGVGVALAIGGALAGSLLPQARATMLPLHLPASFGREGWELKKFLDNLIIIVGTIGSLFYFYFTAHPRQGRLTGLWQRVVNFLGSIGRWTIMITLGAIFGNTVMARVSLLIGRLEFLLRDWLQVIR